SGSTAAGCADGPSARAAWICCRASSGRSVKEARNPSDEVSVTATSRESPAAIPGRQRRRTTRSPRSGGSTQRTKTLSSSRSREVLCTVCPSATKRTGKTSGFRMAALFHDGQPSWKCLRPGPPGASGEAVTRVLSAQTALPDNYVDQETLLAAFREHWGKKHFNLERLEQLHRAVRVGGRHLALPLEEYAALETFAARNAAWTRAAVEVGEAALRAALDDAGLSPGDL